MSSLLRTRGARDVKGARDPDGGVENDHDSLTLGPNWFASVMGTGIVATAGATLPFDVRGLHVFAVSIWLVSLIMLVVLVVAFALHWFRHPDAIARYARDVTLAQFFGAPPMALLTVGAGSILVGHSLIGEATAVTLDWVLWSLGTFTGLLTVVAVPYLLFTRLEVRPDAAFGGWLMPVVPPMVSASTGGLLITHIASPTGRATLLYGCYAMFGMSLVASLIIITLIWSRLAHHGSSGTVRVPTLWIVLGPLGQSITAAGILGANAAHAVPPTIARGFSFFAIAFGVPTWGFALLWIGLAAGLTVRTARHRLPFHLTWWSFTFPVGTFVTGTTRMALATQLPAFRVASAVAYVGLLGAWVLVAALTLRGLVTGRLLRVPLSGGRGPSASKGDLRTRALAEETPVAANDDPARRVS
jgi:C4-dicarboxylate transporter/malic acid transport protein